MSLTVRHGETLALVGESGCGKSTTGRSIIRLEQPDAGEIRLNGEDVTRLDRAREARLRRGVQYVFQDPLASLDPRLTIGFSIAEPIRTHRLLARRGGASSACTNCCAWSGCRRSMRSAIRTNSPAASASASASRARWRSEPQPDHRR